MITASPVAPGTIDQRRYWHCANCGATLGEIVGRRAVIRIADRRMLSVALDADPHQTCPRCGEMNGPPKEVKTN